MHFSIEQKKSQDYTRLEIEMKFLFNSVIKCILVMLEFR